MSTAMDIHQADHWIGATLVRADRGGPWRFERDGQAVECVCDAADGITCEFHARGLPG
jgi:hypothetical protein